MNLPSRCYLAITLLSLGVICSCDRAKPNSREEFVRSLQNPNVDGFRYATSDDKNRAVTSLTNDTDGDFIKLDKGTAGVVLQYTRVRDKTANTTKTYKTEVVKAGNNFELVVTDIAATEAILRKPISNNGDTDPPPADCGSLQSCQEFADKHLPDVQRIANKTCEVQTLAAICCSAEGASISVHYWITPTAPRCLLKDLIPNVNGFVLSK